MDGGVGEIIKAGEAQDGDPRALILGSTTASSFLFSQKVRESRRGRTVPRGGDTHRCHSGHYTAQA